VKEFGWVIVCFFFERAASNTGTMACTQHVPSCNGLHDLHNGHVDFTELACGGVF